MSEPIIDSDEIEALIGETVAEITEEPVACRLEIVRIQDGTFFLQYHLRVIGKCLQINQTLGLSFTMEAFDLERLRKHITTIAGQLRVKLLTSVAEGN
jgi:hypothetical protein